MKMGDWRRTIFFITITIASLFAASSSSFRGIAPQDKAYFQSAIINCRDGSRTFTLSQLNDDFCDCPDGTDEPGTSACPNARFYCRNAAHSPKLLFSSRVNDGICDCCDGSDEPLSLCPNSCWQAGQVARDKLISKISTYQQGVSLRNRLLQQAKAALANDQAELSTLKAQEDTLKPILQHLKHHKQLFDQEDEKKEKEKERLRKITEERENNKPTSHDTIDTNDSPLTDHHDSIKTDDFSSEDDIPEEYSSKDDDDDRLKTQESSAEADVLENTQQLEDEVPEKTEVDISRDDKVAENTEELSREELGRLVASRWTGENTGKQKQDANIENDDTHDHNRDVEDTTKDSHQDDDDDEDDDEEPDAYALENSDDHVQDEAYDDFKEEDPEHSDSSYKYDSDTESDYSDMANPSSPSLFERIQQKFRNILQSINLFQTPMNQSDAARIRKEYDDSTAKLSKIQSRISTLTQKLKHDFGPDNEFYSFYDKCFESKENKYVYKVCPYKQASQEEGHSSTRLGRWNKFEDSYKVMVFSNGDKCWNGPDRSLTVKLRCGLKDEVTDVDEPSRCEYVALLSTPALCVEERLKELQRKLDEMNTNEPQTHDEL